MNTLPLGPFISVWRGGNGAPSGEMGFDGDYYFDLTNTSVYWGPKTSGSWGGTRPFGSLPVTGTPAAGETILTTSGTSAVWTGSKTGPWVFNVATYGAVGDGEFVTDGAMGSGVAVLTSATANFQPGDVGKAILVKGAGAVGVTTLVTTIASRQSATQVTLTASNASGGAVSSALVMWATDDTAHVQAAINAALTYAGTNGSATVFFPTGSGRFYGIAGALQTGGSTLGNSQLTLGPPIATTVNKVALTFEGVNNGSGLQHWQQLSPQVNGSTLMSFGVFANATAQTNSINTNGNACVIGGPAQPGGYGISPGIYSNMLVTLNNLSILTTHSADGFTYGAADFSGVAEANVFDFAYGTAASVADGDYASPAVLATGLAIGLLMPANGNNDNNMIRNLSCHGGYTYALFATEHTVIDRLCILYCWSALCLVGTYFSSVGAVHGVNVLQASIEACTNIVYVVGAGSGGVGPYLFATISTESGSPTFSGNSSTAMNAALGVVTLTGLFTVSAFSSTYPTGLKIINGQQGFVTTPLTSASSPYTVSLLDNAVLIDATSGNVVVDLPSAAWTPNVYTFTRLDASGNTVTITSNGVELIHVKGSAAATTTLLATQYNSLTLYPARVATVWGWYPR